MGRPAAAMTAKMTCTFGLSPSTLVPLPTPRVLIEGKPAATISDMIPGANIPPFGMCSTPANPTVAAATAAALGVLTPMPCLPVTTGPWLNGATTTLIGGKPALAAGAQCLCAYGGVIALLDPATTTTQVG